MAIKIQTREDKTGKKRHTALYQAPSGDWLGAGTYGDKEIAKRAAIAAEIKAGESQWVDPRRGKETLGAFVDRVYLDTIKTLEATTQDGHRSNLRVWILPEFGKKALKEIKPSDVQKWVAKIDATRKPSTVAKAHAILHKIFVWAVRDGVLVTNPCSSTQLPTNPDPEVKILSPEEFERVLAAIGDEQGKRVLLVALGTGMRWSEIAGLCPAQVDFLKKTLRVDRSVVKVNKRENGTQFLSKDYPKGKRPRIVPLDEEALTALSIEIGIRGLDSTSTDLIFTTGRGTPLDRQNFNKRVLEPAVKAAGVEHRTLKHLRSSYCSWLLSGGAPVFEVQALMGHRNLTTTQKYTAVLPEANERALAALRAVRRRSA